MKTTGNEALETTLREWNEAAQGWDVEALTQVYTDDAALFAGRPGQAIGRDAVRGYFASYEGVLTSTTLDLVDQHVVELAPDTFLAQGYGKFKFVLAGGKQSGTVMRTTWVLVRRDGRWKVRQHHFSLTPEAPPING